MFVGGDIFDPFAKIWPHMKVKKDYVWTDNWIYLLHRKWSFIFSLIALICILSYVAIIDHPMHCFGPEGKSVTEDYLKYFCWVWGTYIVPEHLEADKDTIAPMPGIGIENEHTSRMYFSHYVFYPLVILFQACTFRASKYFWQHLEGGRLKTLLSELKSPIILRDAMTERIHLVTDYMTTSPTFFKKYAYNYVFCEVLNLFNIFCQFIIYDIIFHNGFITYGIDAIRYWNQDPPGYPSPFNRMFPKVTKCDLRTYGFSGNIQFLEALCIMPLHNFSEKIFLFSWFWLSFLGIMTMIGLTYRAIVLIFPCARFLILRMKTRGTGCDPESIKYFVKHAPYEKWYVVSMLQKNMSPWVFQNLFTELVEKIKEVEEKRL